MKISSIFLGIILLIGFIKCVSEPVYDVSVLQEIDIDNTKSYSSYYFRIAAFESDSMAIEIKVYKPYNYGQDFDVEIKGFWSRPSDEEIRVFENYTPLYKYEITYQGEYYDTFSYPFETIEGVSYLGFYFGTTYEYKVSIYIKSEKGEEAALGLAIILLIVILPILCIGAVATFLLRKFGCWVRIHSSSI